MINLLRRSYAYYGKIYGVLFLCILLGLFQGVLALIEPQILALIVDRAITPALGYTATDDSSIFLFLVRNIPNENVWEAMLILIGVFILFLLLYFITFYIRWNIAHYYSIKVDNALRLDVVKKINSFGTRLLKKYTTGELITIANSDTGKLRDAHVAVIPFMIDSIFAVIVGSIMLSRLSIYLMMIPLIALFISGAITRGFLKKMGVLYGAMWEQNTALNTETQESIYGIRTIKAYAKEAVRIRRFQKRCDSVRNSYINLGNTRYRFMLIFDTSDQLITLICMIVSIILAVHMKMTSGEYMAFISYMLIIVGNFVGLIFHMADIQEEIVSGNRLFTFLALEDTVRQQYGTREVSNNPCIQVEHLTLVNQDKYLLHDVSVSIPYGKKIGIMGKTGSGKSVFLKVLQAFMEVDSGTILFDGKESKAYSMDSIARTFSYAMQDVFLFSNTIAANIAYYDPEASEERIYKCGKIAEVEEFIDRLPQKYETIVGEKGFGLSGGQKQRVAIARALLKDAPVLLFDDCTSALDLDTEAAIFHSLSMYCKDKTLLMATHRAQAIKDCDEILFFEDGRIVERGTFEELMKQNGRYARIYRRQMIEPKGGTQSESESIL